MSFLTSLLNALPAIAQGLLWGFMALGVYITFRLLDVADLSVDGSFATGGAVTVMLIIAGRGPRGQLCSAALLVGVLAGLVHRAAAHEEARNPRHSCRYPYAVRALFRESAYHGHEGEPDGKPQNLRHVLGKRRQGLPLSPVALVPQAIGIGFLLAAVLIALLYWFSARSRARRARDRLQPRDEPRAGHQH